MTTAEVVVTADNLTKLPAESREAAVTQYLASVRDWLAAIAAEDAASVRLSEVTR